MLRSKLLKKTWTLKPFQLRSSNKGYLTHASCTDLPTTLPHAHAISTTLNLNCPVFQIFGSNTDVGKTIVSAALLQAACQDESTIVNYIKPIQTGLGLTDAEWINRMCMNPMLQCETLFQWDTPVSPHRAAQLEEKQLSNGELLQHLQERLKILTFQEYKNKNGIVFIETAGGVCSPAPSGSLQVDVYRPLRLPVVLVGDGKLGGISATLSALDSLLLRGFDIAAIAVIEQDGLDNGSVLAMNSNQHSIPVVSLPALPPKEVSLHQWYNQVVHGGGPISTLYQHLLDFQSKRIQALQTLPERAKDVIWWPFTQHKNCAEVTVIDSAYADHFTTYNHQNNSLKSVFDACASWWTQGVGRGNSKTSQTLAYAASRYGHVMFPENAHEPAIQLAEKLVQGSIGKGWASKVFYSDNGSTALEVALKMAMRTFMSDHHIKDPSNLVVLAQKNCYHGDTLGVMNVAVPSVYNYQQQPWYSPKGIFVDPPSIACINGIYELNIPGHDERRNFSSFEEIFQLHRNPSIENIYRKIVVDAIETSTNTVSALLLEPILLGAGGMILIDPFFQKVMIQECRSRKIPVVFDEVFCGCYRLGVASTRQLLQEQPDIACYAKLLTGGTLPLAATVTTQRVFDAFLGDTKAEALLHGHSYTANPIGCATALTSLDMYDLSIRSHAISGYWDESQVVKISMCKKVRRAFSIGTVFVLEVVGHDLGYSANDSKSFIDALKNEGIAARSLGNTLYFMCSPLTTAEVCFNLLDTAYRILNQE